MSAASSARSMMAGTWLAAVVGLGSCGVATVDPSQCKGFAGVVSESMMPKEWGPIPTDELVNPKILVVTTPEPPDHKLVRGFVPVPGLRMSMISDTSEWWFVPRSANTIDLCRNIEILANGEVIRVVAVERSDS